jgi:hypothetical protein
MVLHQTKELLHSKGNSYQTQETAHRICRELKKLSPQRNNTPVKKWAHELNREFSKEDIQRAREYMKKCSTSLVIR